RAARRAVLRRRPLAPRGRHPRYGPAAVRRAGIVHAMTRLWHPFADMAVVKDAEVVIERGDGAVVWDEQGREYIDARGGLWYCAAGHGRGEIADAAADQMRRLAASTTGRRGRR